MLDMDPAIAIVGALLDTDASYALTTLYEQEIGQPHPKARQWLP